jgi:hypothetical protein
MTVGQPARLSWCHALIWVHDQIVTTVRHLRICRCGAPSLARGLVSSLHLLRLGSAAILRLYFCVSNFRISNSKARFLYFLPPGILYPQALTLISVNSELKSELYYHQLLVVQFFLVSGTHSGPMTRCLLLLDV